MDWTSLQPGQRVNGVLSVICFDAKGNKHLTQTSDRRCLKAWVMGSIPCVSAIAGVGLLVTSVLPLQLLVDSSSVVVSVPPCDRTSLMQVVELCSGLGGFSSVAPRVGFSVQAGVDQNGRWRSLFESLHQGSTFYCGDLGDSAVLAKLLHHGVFHGVLLSGVACQPHSVLGDRRGMADPRAQSLPQSLHFAWMLQSAIVVLECTSEVLRDAQAQDLLKQFCLATGYRMTQTVLQLSNSWCSRRDRWIAILTAPVVQMCTLPDMPQDTPIQVIRDLIPQFTPWHEFDQAQLVLNLYELSKYYQYAAGGIESVFVQTHDKLGTLLHSAGNQLYTCACGCRAALSESRLQQKGLVGTLIPLGTSQVHMHICMHHARYLHPVEMWALMGGDPTIDVGHNLRLAMAGIGQAVAPLMSIWVLAHVRRCLDLTLDDPPCDPGQVFHTYMEEIIAACRTKWPVPSSVIAPTLDDPIEDCDSTHVITLSRPCAAEPDVQVRISSSTTGAHLLAAESQLGNASEGFQIRVDGEPHDISKPLGSANLVSLLPADWDPAQLRAEPVVPCCMSIEDFLRFIRASDASDPGHVTSISCLSQSRVPVMSQMERMSLLQQQGPVWGDDELLSGLQNIALTTDGDQCVVVWDPLLVTGLVNHDVPSTWQYLVNRLGSLCTVISVVLLGGHWIPLVWRIDTAGVKLHSLSVAAEFGSTLESLARTVGLYQGGVPGVWRAHSVGFVPSGYCGAVALAFVRHLLWGWPMPTDQAALLQLDLQLRSEFASQVSDPCIRPQLAGLGLSTQNRLAEVLSQHGVPTSESASRAAAALKALGEDGVSKALASPNVWRELKWLGNQLRPPYMLIKPSELQAQIEKRAHDAPVGHKKHKHQRSAKGKGKGQLAPTMVDPTLLRMETGIFQSASGQPLGQLALSQVGSSAAGVVVVAAKAIEPYLKASHPLSSGPLAFFVVDSPGVPPTQFPVSQERVPLLCAVNSEPLLVDGHLIQLGAVSVQRAPMQPGCEVQSIPTCVVKALIFRDQTPVPWADVVAHPLLHIFAQVPPLQQCLDDECPGCEGWHRSQAFPMDTPVLEIWGKQWLGLDFRHVPPDQAELFTAHLRLQHLQLQVQHFSGHDGVFLEPKSLDGRHPSPDFQVIWMPKADPSQLMLQRQTVANIVGLARLGHKMGLRCRTEHASDVFAVLRPGQTFLPPGKRQSYLVGPFAYGTLQASVAQVLQANGWTAKPVQVVAAKTHIQGLMFRVHSVQAPPKKVIRMAHGDVMIAQEPDLHPAVPELPRVVATSATESFVSKQCDGDFLQQYDPWAKAASRLPSKGNMFQIGNPLEDVTQKVLSEVMAQLPKSQMEVDGDEALTKRVDALEQQVQALHGQNTALANATQQANQENQAQFQELRGQIQEQGLHFDQAIAAQASNLQGFQDSFQEQFRHQVVHQQTMLDNMFNKQMIQFESLLAKRPRQE